MTKSLTGLEPRLRQGPPLPIYRLAVAFVESPLLVEFINRLTALPDPWLGSFGFLEFRRPGLPGGALQVEYR